MIIKIVNRFFNQNYTSFSFPLPPTKRIVCINANLLIIYFDWFIYLFIIIISQNVFKQSNNLFSIQNEKFDISIWKRVTN